MSLNPFNYRRPIVASSPMKAASSPSFHDKIWTVLKWIFGVFRRICFALGLLTLLSIVLWGVLLAKISNTSAPPQLPKEMVLYLHLDGVVRDQNKLGAFENPFKPPLPTLRQITQAINAASQDDAVKALFVKMGDADFSLTQITEMRQSIQSFRATGKKAYIYAPSYDAGAGGLSGLYFASAFDSRWMQPLGIVAVTGLRIEMPFLKNILDKLGVTPDFYQRKSYKTAYESMTHDGMSAANRRALTHVIDVLKTEISASLSTDLGIENTNLQSLIDAGILIAPEAMEEEIITHLGYPDQIVDYIKQESLGDNKKDNRAFVSVISYLDHIQQANFLFSRPEIALIHVDGAIVSSAEGQRDNVAAASRIAPAILAAAKDDKIKAIVLRVNSPGGSPVASDTILHAMHQAKEQGKPVIVSMGGVAASGGYWVASGADYIFALPMTLTGSIGVVGGKIALEDMWQKIGVNWDSSIQWGDNAGMWSVNQAFTKDNKIRINAMLDHIYNEFINRVATGRNMDEATVETLAQGRVWPGKTAHEKGLVDALGGLDDAIAYAAQHIGEDDPSAVRIVEMPKPRSTIEQLLELMEQQGSIYEGLKIQMDLLKTILPISDLKQITAEGSLYNTEKAITYSNISVD